MSLGRFAKFGLKEVLQQIFFKVTMRLKIKYQIPCLNLSFIQSWFLFFKSIYSLKFYKTKAFKQAQRQLDIELQLEFESFIVCKLYFRVCAFNFELVEVNAFLDYVFVDNTLVVC